MSVRHALLALLSEGPKYGLQLREEFEARTGEVWPLNVGQVYTTLQRLERDGLVESDGDGQDGPQKGFRITSAGARELSGWLRTPSDMSLALVVDAELFRLDAVVRWLDAADGRIKRGADLPADPQAQTTTGTTGTTGTTPAVPKVRRRIGARR